MEPLKTFVSYSSSDRLFAKKLATDLRSNGVDAWFDRWEIAPGDSLVEKLNHGLAGCDIFVVILSQSSVASRWVREELDAATIARIERQARLIPVKIEECAVPPLLSALVWIDFRGRSYEEAFRELLKSIVRKSEKPDLGPLPDYAGPFVVEPMSGLTREGTRVLSYLVEQETKRQFSYVPAEDIQAGTGLGAEEINDAIDELEGMGAVKIHKATGTAPFTFHLVQVTCEAFVLAKDILDYDPEQDIQSVAVTVASLKMTCPPKTSPTKS